MSIRIVTDSASDILPGQLPGVTVLPMTLRFGEETFEDGVTLSHRQFYEKLVESSELPTTSQIPPFAFEEVFREAAAAGDTVLTVVMSGQLSGTYQSACIAAEGFADTVRVVDSESVTVGERILIEYACQLRDKGLTVREIGDILEAEKYSIHVVALLDTLEYLKKGGRISKATAIAGTFLGIKPVVSLDHGRVVLLGKARGSRLGNNMLKEEILKAGGIAFDRPLLLGYTGLTDVLLQKYIADAEDLWKGRLETLPIITVGGTIGTHVGPGAIAAAFFAPSAGR